MDVIIRPFKNTLNYQKPPIRIHIYIIPACLFVSPALFLRLCGTSRIQSELLDAEPSSENVPPLRARTRRSFFMNANLFSSKPFVVSSLTSCCCIVCVCVCVLDCRLSLSMSHTSDVYSRRFQPSLEVSLCVCIHVCCIRVLFLNSVCVLKWAQIHFSIHHSALIRCRSLSLSLNNTHSHTHTHTRLCFQCLVGTMPSEWCPHKPGKTHAKKWIHQREWDFIHGDMHTLLVPCYATHTHTHNWENSVLHKFRV